MKKVSPMRLASTERHDCVVYLAGLVQCKGDRGLDGVLG